MLDIKRGLLDIKTCNDIPLLIAWAIRMDRYGSPVVSEAAQHLVQLLLMPEIRLGFHYENELGLYFARTKAWHETPGPLNGRPGFRMLEMHSFYWNLWRNLQHSTSTLLQEVMSLLGN